MDEQLKNLFVTHVVDRNTGNIMQEFETLFGYMANLHIFNDHLFAEFHVPTSKTLLGMWSKTGFEKVQNTLMDDIKTMVSELNTQPRDLQLVIIDKEGNAVKCTNFPVVSASTCDDWFSYEFLSREKEGYDIVSICVAVENNVKI